MTLNISLREVVSFKEERLVESPREGIREAIAEIETGWMASLAVFPKGTPGDFGLLGVYGYQGDLGLCDKKVEGPYAISAKPGFEDH
jgi:hypothetical protein